MIEISNVSKFFGNKTAVKKLSFVAREASIVGLLGPNGAGKTTTMRLITGYISPNTGTIRINGHDPIQNRKDVLSDVGYLPENNPLYLDMKVIEYLQFVAKVKKEHSLNTIIGQTGLKQQLTTKIDVLSRGYKQRVGLAAALCGDPKILILDEPTSGLDPLEQEKIQDLIISLAKKKTVIFSTHILSEVEEIADNLIILSNGNMVYEGKKPSGKGAVEKLFKKVVKT